MGICEDAPDEYCGHVLKPEDVGLDEKASNKWQKDAHNAVCLREPKYNGLCVWHADKKQKSIQELIEAKQTSEDVCWDAECVKEHLGGAILRGIRFPDGFSFRDCILSFADFSRTTLRQAKFGSGYLYKTNFRNADLRGVDFF